MNRYNITNLVSGHTYAITDDDLAAKGVTLDQWLERKANAYGHGERRFPTTYPDRSDSIVDDAGSLVHVIPAMDPVVDEETGEVEFDGHPEIRRPLSEVHPEWYAVGTPVLDGDEVVVPAEYSVEVEDIGNPTLDNALSKLWKDAWEWAGQYLSIGDLAIIQGWRDEGILSQTGVDMLVDIRVWHDTIFAGPYATAKALIEAEGGWVEPDWGSWPPAPHGFSDFQAQRTA